MNRDLTNIAELVNINPGNKNSVSKLLKVINQIRSDGFDEVNIKIEGSLKKIVINSGYSLKSFNKIKTMQELPEKTVLDLMDSCGKLKFTGLDKRVGRSE